MVYFDKSIAKEKTLDYLRYPVPRTPISIVRHLKKEVDNFYPKTNGYRVVKKLREEVLNDLINQGLILKYKEGDREWGTAKELIKREYEASSKTKPRKLKEVYQINFFYLSKDNLTYKLPVIKDVNIELTALLYRFMEEKEVKNFSLKLLNLFHCYDKEEYKGRIRMKIHGKRFNEKESRLLDRSLDHTSEIRKVLNELPFKPDISEAESFLDEL